ncbi:type VI secretion system baseplate subunit TssF [Acidovorax sp. SUPP2522]|uniref:type VI secretion system baseplate subunit TssF n=1 Tax=unclassified Acidovorax TaxID=2684926 RepID=UPI002349E84F|nr:MULTISPECIES: type VI secretion system baseplate subunit TssF [unclassified Acidovorax]WCM95685.1 type VI secretion system baseplate subunit TssF [Acidovorax sp. GBBC 1281]GKT17600.1 type VI secretion system baseplate subunit TssF [Acidovorax sp. SUPP2522]
MNPRLVEYYNRELSYLRELGAEFAAAFPKVAGRLSLRELEVADPYVERLLEGFSFLTARIQMKMDAEFPRLSQRILEMVCPHYLAPTPSMVVVQMDPSASEGSLADGYTLPVGSVLRARKTAEEQTPCDFRTGHELTLWPIDLTQARLGGPPLDLPLSRLRLPEEPAAHLRIDLSTRGALRFCDLRMDRLEVHISAGDAVASHLQELIHESLIGIVVHDAQDPSRVWAHLPADALQAEGYEQSQALLPYSHRSFQGHRLLHEYFAFPARFRFFSIRGLQTALAKAETKAIAITLLLRRAQPALEAQVDRHKFLLHCVPAINLFERPADRIHVAPNVNEYHVVPDRTRPRDFEIYSVLGVTGHREGQLNDREFVPLFSSIHGIRSSDQAYFAARREPRLFSEHAARFGPRTQYLGSEVFISLVDQREAPFSDDLKQLSVRTLCTNRDLPLLMGGRSSEGDFTTVESVPVDRVRTVAGPTRPTSSVAENEITWRLISHLSLNYLAMTDLSEEEGAATLRDLLRLYLDLGDKDLSGQVSSIKGVGISAITRRLPQHGQLVYGRGVGVSVGVDESSLAGVSPWPLMAVLERFFARHVGVNSYTELALDSRQRGRIAQWRVRPGQRPCT